MVSEVKLSGVLSNPILRESSLLFVAKDGKSCSDFISNDDDAPDEMLVEFPIRESLMTRQSLFRKQHQSSFASTSVRNKLTALNLHHPHVKRGKSPL